jgi:hypothetical protein
MARRKNEIIFEARIDYSDRRDLSLGDIRESPEIEQRVTRVLTQDLPHEMETIFGMNIDVQIKGTRQGSILILFGAVIAGVSPLLSALSRYKNLSDSVVLIKNQAERAIRTALNEQRIGTYSVDVEVVDPTERSLVEDTPRRWWRRHMPFPVEFMPDNFSSEDSHARHRRDGFFWFLLALCILEGVAIAMLMYRAVINTYFR